VDGKIKKVKSSFTNLTHTHADSEKFSGLALAEFKPTSVFELELIPKESPIKISSIDPLPKEVLSKNLQLLLPTICDIVNLSPTTGSIEGSKLANLTPLIKGSLLTMIDPSLISNSLEN
jgi:hypothetical protein